MPGQIPAPDGTGPPSPPPPGGPAAPSDAAVAPGSGSPAPSDSPNPSASPDPSASTNPSDSPAAANAPSRDEQLARRRILQAKVAGVMMMLMGAFFGIQLAQAAYAVPRLAETMAATDGGTLVLSVPAHPGADVALVYRSGAPTTRATLDSAGNATLHPTNATFELRVATNGTTLVRQAFVPAGFNATAVIREAGTGPVVGYDVARANIFWAFAALCGVITMAGIFAFRLRGPRVALAGAALLLVGTVYVATALGVAQVISLSLLGTGVMSFLFIFKARAYFAPALPRRSRA